jgi:hypothetical protein
MKPLITILFLVVALSTGCKKSTDTVIPATATFPQIIAPGVWTISSFTQGTEDKLKLLSNIRIDFSSDGKAVATQDNVSTPGTWSWGGNSYYGTPADSKTVSLNFGTTKPYDRLSKVWTIIEAKSSVISLDNSNPAENEHLTLSK